MRDDCLDIRRGMVDVGRSEAELLSRRSVVGLCMIADRTRHRRQAPLVRCVPGYTMDATARDL
jgi:hypothetical protein